MQKLVVFTHNDLDALGCMLNIEYRFPDVPKIYFHTNYRNIPQIVYEIKQHQKINKDRHLIIPDVSFSDNKEAMIELYNIFENITHIDHHMYPENWWDGFDRMKVVYDKDKSATLLCNEYLGNAGKNPRLDAISQLIDVYDIWRSESKHFSDAQDFNDYFWQNDITNLKNQIISNDWKFPSNYIPMVKAIRKKSKEDIADMRERKLIQKSGDISIVFGNEWFNKIQIQEMNNGSNIVIGVTNYGIIRVRFKNSGGVPDEVKNELRYRTIGVKELGHMNAFTFRVKEPINFDNIMEEVQGIIKNLKELRNF